MAGTSGNAGKRVALVTPKALSRPALMCPWALPMLANINSTCPANTSAMA